MTSHRPFPNNPELEAVVLGGLLIEDDVDTVQTLCRKLSDDDFMERPNKRVFKSITDLLQADKKPDMVSVCGELPNLASHLTDITRLNPPTALLPQRVAELREVTAKRKAYKFCLEFGDRFHAATYVPDELVRMAIQLEGIRGLVASNSVSVDARDINPSHLAEGVLTGFVTHDYNDSGMKEGCLTLVTGVKGAGKTTFIRQVILACAFQKVKTYYFIGESSMSTEKRNLARLCASSGEITRTMNRAGRYIYSTKQVAVDKFESLFAEFVAFSDVD